tara:strand:- start:312 stop:566 length:255 start_codon:yes stop_codon:yes gene_type:complete
MSENKEELKNKIIYRSSYRGTKEMDILMSNFVKSVIDDLTLSELKELNILVNLSDENLITVKNGNVAEIITPNIIIKKFQDFKL